MGQGVPTGATPAAPGATPATPATSTNVTVTPPPPNDDTTALGETGIAALREERKQREAAERSLRAAERERDRLAAEVKTRDEQGLSELDKANKRVAELEAEQAARAQREQDREVRLVAIEVATRLNFRSPDLAYRLIERGDVEFAKDGTPKNIEALLKALLDKEPYLAKAGGSDFGGGNRGATPPHQPNMNDIIRGALKPGG